MKLETFFFWYVALASLAALGSDGYLGGVYFFEDPATFLVGLLVGLLVFMLPVYAISHLVVFLRKRS